MRSESGIDPTKKEDYLSEEEFAKVGGWWNWGWGWGWGGVSPNVTVRLCVEGGGVEGRVGAAAVRLGLHGRRSGLLGVGTALREPLPLLHPEALSGLCARTNCAP